MTKETRPIQSIMASGPAPEVDILVETVQGLAGRRQIELHYTDCLRETTEKPSPSDSWRYQAIMSLDDDLEIPFPEGVFIEQFGEVNSVHYNFEMKFSGAEQDLHRTLAKIKSISQSHGLECSYELRDYYQIFLPELGVSNTEVVISGDIFDVLDTRKDIEGMPRDRKALSFKTLGFIPYWSRGQVA